MGVIRGFTWYECGWIWGNRSVSNHQSAERPGIQKYLPGMHRYPSPRETVRVVEPNVANGKPSDIGKETWEIFASSFGEKKIGFPSQRPL